MSSPLKTNQKTVFFNHSSINNKLTLINIKKKELTQLSQDQQQQQPHKTRCYKKKNPTENNNKINNKNNQSILSIDTKTRRLFN